VRLNTREGALVELSVRLGYGSLLAIAMLLLAPPAWAAGDRSMTPLPSTLSSRVAVAPPAVSNIVPPTSVFPVVTQPFTPSRSVSAPLPSTVLPAPERPHHRRPIAIVGAPATQVVVVQQPIIYAQTVTSEPTECVNPGYWAYRWVPYATTERVWVAGSWAADGTWTDSHYEVRPYSSGYYEPVWTPEQAYAC
jgi:hypothetical protein